MKRTPLPPQKKPTINRHHLAPRSNTEKKKRTRVGGEAGHNHVALGQRGGGVRVGALNEGVNLAAAVLVQVDRQLLGVLPALAANRCLDPKLLTTIHTTSKNRPQPNSKKKKKEHPLVRTLKTKSSKPMVRVMLCWTAPTSSTSSGSRSRSSSLPPTKTIVPLSVTITCMIGMSPASLAWRGSLKRD